MRDETRIIANTLVSYGSRVVAAVVGILMVPYLLHRLGEEQYGTIGILNALLTLSVLVDLGLRPAITRQFTRFLFGGETERANEIASTGLAAYALLAFLVLVTAAMVGESFLESMKVAPALLPEAFTVFIIISAVFAFRLIRTPFQAVLASQLRFDIQQYTETGGIILRAGVIVAVFTLWEPRLIVWALAALLAVALAVLIERRQAYLRCPPLKLRRRAVSRRGLRDLMGFSAYTSLLRLGAWLSEQSGPLIISSFMGTAPVALYVPATVLVLQLQPLSQAFLGQLSPVVTKAHAAGQREQIGRILLRSTRYALLLGGGANVLLATLAYSLVLVWLGEGFQETAWVLIAWSCRSLLHALVGGGFPVFIGTGHVRSIAILNTALAVLSVAASVYLVGWAGYGILGPALAVLGAQVIRTLVYYLQATRICRITRIRYFRESLARPLLCLAVLAISAHTLARLIEPQTVVALLVAAGLSLLPFIGLVWAIGLNPEDRSKAREYAGAAWRYGGRVVAGPGRRQRR